MQRGEVWQVSLPFTSGREQAGSRPAIIIQDALYGQASPLVLLVPLTSQLTVMRFPATVLIEPAAGTGLAVQSVAMVFQARSIDRSRLIRRLGSVSSVVLSEVLNELNKLVGR